jgi:tetratricopeptide (TPR) repeat protein
MIFAQQWRGEEALDCWKNAITIKEQVVSTTREVISSFEAFRGEVSMLIYNAAEQFSSAAHDDSHDHAIHENGRIGMHLDAAKLCNAVGDIDRATDHLESVIQLSPDHAEAMYVLGTLREKQGRLVEAKSLVSVLCYQSRSNILNDNFVVRRES